MLGVSFQSEHRGWMQDQWSWVFSNFGITDIWESHSDHDGERGKDGSIYQPTIKISSADELPKDIPLVVIQPINGRFIKGTVSLKDFEHPEDAIYMFGGSHSMMHHDDFGDRVADHLVYIPTVKLEMYSFAAAYITLWDRFVKNG